MPYRDNAYSDAPFCDIVKNVAEKSNIELTKKAIETTTIEYNLLVKPHILKLAEKGIGQVGVRELEELLSNCHMETLKRLLINDQFSIWANHNSFKDKYNVIWYK